MSSATVRRAGCGMDSTISPIHLPSVAGRPASGRGSMIPAGVWCNTRNMGAGRPAAPPHPFQTAPTPPGLETPVALSCSLGWRIKRGRPSTFVSEPDHLALSIPKSLNQSCLFQLPETSSWVDSFERARPRPGRGPTLCGALSYNRAQLAVVRDFQSFHGVLLTACSTRDESETTLKLIPGIPIRIIMLVPNPIQDFSSLEYVSTMYFVEVHQCG